MANFEVTLPITGTATFSIEADSKENAIAQTLAGKGYPEREDWQICGTMQDATVKAFDNNWEEIKDAIALPDFPFKVDYRFPEHPNWNTVEDWHGDSDPDSINTVATSINDKKLKLCSTDLNPTIDLSDFKQSAVVSGDILIVTFIQIAMAKPKKKKVEAVIEDGAIAVLAPLNGDRYKSIYETWEDFVKDNFPEDKYPSLRKEYLRK